MKAGALLSYLSIFITILIALLYTPVMLRLLGQSEYGLYSLIGSVAAYFSVMDMGLGTAIVRYIARNRAIGDKNAEFKMNGMFLILYTLIGLLTILIGIMVYNNIDNIFGQELTLLELKKAKIMILILIVNFSVSFPLSVFSSIIRAYEKFIVEKLVAIVRSMLGPALTLPFLFLGYGAIVMITIITIVNILCLIFNSIYALRVIGTRIRFGKFDLKLLKEIMGFSFFVFLAVIVDRIYWSTDQIILGIFSGTLPVAVYAIAMQFIILYMQFSTSISGLFLPKASMMVANNASSKELTNMMIKYGRIQYIIMAYILSGFILFGKPFINIWAGTNYGNAYYIALIIMLPFTIPLIQNTGLSILYAKNLQGYRSIVLLSVAIINVLISIPLAKNYGGLGVALATGATLVVGDIILMNIYYHRKLKINIYLFWENIFFMSLPVLIALIIGFSLIYLIAQETILFLILKIIFFSIFYICIMWFLGMNKYEKELLSSMIVKCKDKIIFLNSKNKKGA